MLSQRLDILDAQNKEKGEGAGGKKDEVPKLSQKDLLKLAKKNRKGGGVERALPGKGGGRNARKNRTKIKAGEAGGAEATEDDDLSIASAILEEGSVNSVESSKMREKLLAQIEEAKRVQREEGLERTKQRVNEMLRRRWFNALSDHERFVFTHRKLARRENIVRACRRKLSIKGALFNWWPSKLVSVFVCHILKVLETEHGMLGKVKQNCFLVGGAATVASEKTSEAGFSDDESSIASSVFSKKSKASIASSSIPSSIGGGLGGGGGRSNVSSVFLEQGSLDPLFSTFEAGIPVYEPFNKLMKVKNGVYFPVPQEDPRIKEAIRLKEEKERKKAAGLLLDDGTESEEQSTARKAKQAKMLWRRGSNRVRMSVALSSEVRRVDQGDDRIENSSNAEAHKKAQQAEEEEASRRARQVSNHLLGCSYSDAAREAIAFYVLNGRKWRAIMEEAEQDAEVVLEHMKEQSLLLDVSQQGKRR